MNCSFSTPPPETESLSKNVVQIGIFHYFACGKAPVGRDIHPAQNANIIWLVKNWECKEITTSREMFDYDWWVFVAMLWNFQGNYVVVSGKLRSRAVVGWLVVVPRHWNMGKEVVPPPVSMSPSREYSFSENLFSYKLLLCLSRRLFPSFCAFAKKKKENRRKCCPRKLNTKPSQFCACQVSFVVRWKFLGLLNLAKISLVSGTINNSWVQQVIYRRLSWKTYAPYALRSRAWKGKDSFCEVTLFPDANVIYRFTWINSRNNISQLCYSGVFSVQSWCYLVLTLASASSVTSQKLSKENLMDVAETLWHHS